MKLLEGKEIAWEIEGSIPLSDLDYSHMPSQSAYFKVRRADAFLGPQHPKLDCPLNDS